MSAYVFQVGDRVQDRPGTSDRFEGPGTVASVSEPRGDGRQFVAVRHDNTTVTSWWAEELEPADDPQIGQSRVTCSTRACNGAHIVGDRPTTEAWMDQHAATVAHDTRWPACFRISYPGSSLPGVAYRDSRTAEDLDAAPEPVYLEADGVVMKTSPDDSNLPDLLDDDWRQITEAEAMSWQSLYDADAAVVAVSFAPPADAEPTWGGLVPPPADGKAALHFDEFTGTWCDYDLQHFEDAPRPVAWSQAGTMSVIGRAA